jgi:peptidoglycan/xylan/chitin deacetylase (PgdA/CDA1 family)
MNPDDERAIVTGVLDTIANAVGTRPRGWLGPELTETDNTLDILAEAGIDYVCDWTNDELPYEITTSSKQILAMPYTLEIGDIPVFLQHGGTGEDFYRILVDQFDQLYEEGAKNPRVMSIAVHPFLIGHPFRARALDRALAYITAHDQVWLATGSGIADWFRG